MGATDDAPVDRSSDRIELSDDPSAIDLPTSIATVDRLAVAEQHTVGSTPASGIGQAGGGDSDLHDHPIQCLLTGSDRSHQPFELSGLTVVHINR